MPLTMTSRSSVWNRQPTSDGNPVGCAEQAGVIRGYTVLVDSARAGTIDVYTEVRLTGDTATEEAEVALRGLDEVQEA